jgi:hypothetical protein
MTDVAEGGEHKEKLIAGCCVIEGEVFEVTHVEFIGAAVVGRLGGGEGEYDIARKEKGKDQMSG